MKAAVPELIRLPIERTNDLEVLDNWFDASLEGTSWTDFQIRTQQR